LQINKTTHYWKKLNLKYDPLSSLSHKYFKASKLVNFAKIIEHNVVYGQSLLFIIGEWGSGKTSFARYLCKNYNYSYLSSYDYKKILSLKDKGEKVIVIDNVKKIIPEDLKALVNLQTSNFKIILLGYETFDNDEVLFLNLPILDNNDLISLIEKIFDNDVYKKIITKKELIRLYEDSNKNITIFKKDLKTLLVKNIYNENNIIKGILKRYKYLIFTTTPLFFVSLFYFFILVYQIETEKVLNLPRQIIYNDSQTVSLNTNKYNVVPKHDNYRLSMHQNKFILQFTKKEQPQVLLQELKKLGIEYFVIHSFTKGYSFIILGFFENYAQAKSYLKKLSKLILKYKPLVKSVANLQKQVL